jgi:A/G-specific adenine glycosylase
MRRAAALSTSGIIRPPDRAALTSSRARSIRGRLLRWYDQQRRDLPWRRRSHDAYAQWVAEIMLQQTQVETVRDYYVRFLTRFPDVMSLAAAPREQVLKAWEGLGYYRRAMHLHAAARQIAADDGKMPATRAALQALPGIGRYTSAAIASIAYGEPVAAVDGNVKRVLSRLFALPRPGENLTTQIQALAERLLDRRRPGDFNQAWMDLGATICRPREPRCGQCPLESVCLGKPAASVPRDGRFTSRVARRAAATRRLPIVVQTVLIARRGDALFMRPRPDDGLWAGLWEFPTVEGVQHESAATHLASVGLRATGPAVALARIERRLTHRLFQFYPLLIPADDARPRRRRSRKPGRWVRPRQRARLPISTAHRRVLDFAVSGESLTQRPEDAKR